MKLSTAYAEPGDATLVVGAMQQKGAHLAVDASIFNILSRMYSRPEEAVTRELICNANDAHILAGRADVPFELYLPTTMKPEWTLRDFGPGLSKDDVFRLIGGYGESNKRQDLRVIGGFGIGAKSPFAVTTQYTITSWHGGKRMLFAFYKDDEDKPVLSLMDEAASDEPAGMRFSFAVPPDRISQYIQATEVVLARWAGVEPKIQGTNHIFRKVKYRIQRSTFGLRDHLSGNTYRKEGVFAIMGGVAYPIDVKQLSTKYHQLADANLDLLFDIGDLKPAPSRESLEMTPAVAKALETRIDDISAAIKQEAEKVIGTPTSLLEAITAKGKLKEFVAVLPASFRQFVVSEMMFNGMPVPDTSYFDLTLPGDVKYVIRSTRQIAGDGFERFTREAERVINTYDYNNRNFSLNYRTAVMWLAAPMANLELANRLINITDETVSTNATKVIVVFGDRSQEILDYLKVIEVTEELGYISDIPPAEPLKRERTKTKMRKLKYPHYSMLTGGWSEAEVYLEGGGIYQILERGVPTYSMLGKLVDVLTFMGVQLPDIYGIPLSTKSKLTRHKKVWTDFETWATAQIKALDFTKLLREVEDFDEVNGVQWIDKVKESLPWENNLPRTSEAYKLLKDLDVWDQTLRAPRWREQADVAIDAAIKLGIDGQTDPLNSEFRRA